ncbi:MAG TPA: putative metal-binding motif-containing protein, partial [Myxococcota bacterium]|nr:putative metal-binding motif-containing protein [Myxococcota bacterium]
MLLLLQLLACAPSADPFDALDALPVGEAGPPLPFDVTALLPGQVARAVVQGPPQGATVLLAASAAGPGAGPCDPSGATCLDITSPRLFAMQWSGGRWQFSGPVPPRTGTRWFQAVASYNGVTSKSAVIERVFGDADLDLHAAGDDCDDTDPHIYVGAPEPCDSVDNDCDGTVDEDGCAGDGWRAVGGFAVLNGSGSAFSASECATNFFGTTTPTVGGVPFELAVAPGASMIGVPSGAVVSAPFADHQPTAVYVINPG